MRKRQYNRALLQGKCPRCYRGDIFAFPIRRIPKFNAMNSNCQHCNVSFEPEPGFYQGAMYVGYGITVACITILTLFLYVFGNPSEWVYIGVVVVFMIFVAPVNYRYSRILYLYFFGGIKYDSRYSQ